MKVGTTDDDWFIDQASESGLDFVHVNGMTGERYIAEIMAPGVALLDYDNDGDLDVYITQGQMLGPGPAPVPPGRLPLKDRLFRNDLVVNPDGTRTIHFTDVTEQSGINLQTYGMGVAVGDFNNDGFVDIYRTSLNGAVLLRNNGNGTFTDVTKEAGVADPGGWSVSATFFDYDRDGWLDLFVGNYIRYSLASETACVGPSGVRDYCNPHNYPAAPGRLYRNQRDGTFADVTAAAGIGREYGPALGAIAVDVTGDGWPDLYVANDGSDNQLWINQRNGTFKNGAVLSGVAVNGNGRPEGSMGIDAGDFDNDGDEDLLITNLMGEGSTVYANNGSGIFEDVSAALGVRGVSLPYTGFGTAWIDFDNDGWLDILTVNGAIQMLQALLQARDPFPVHQRKQLLRHTGSRGFEDVTAAAGGAFALSDVGRGAAFGDIDNDGDMDIVVGNNNGPIRLLINRLGSRKHWLGVRAVGVGGRDMLGARVAVVLRDGSIRWRRAHADGSYASANDSRVLFGLNASTDVARVRIQWPDGRTDEWPAPGVDHWMTLKEGTSR